MIKADFFLWRSILVGGLPFDDINKLILSAQLFCVSSVHICIIFNNFSLKIIQKGTVKSLVNCSTNKIPNYRRYIKNTGQIK